MARLPTTGRLWLDWAIVGALAVVVSVALAWQLGLWLGIVPLVVVLPLLWRGGGDER